MENDPFFPLFVGFCKYYFSAAAVVLAYIAYRIYRIQYPTLKNIPLFTGSESASVGPAPAPPAPVKAEPVIPQKPSNTAVATAEKKSTRRLQFGNLRYIWYSPPPSFRGSKFRPRPSLVRLLKIVEEKHPDRLERKFVGGSDILELPNLLDTAGRLENSRN